MEIRAVDGVKAPKKDKHLKLLPPPPSPPFSKRLSVAHLPECGATLCRLSSAHRVGCIQLLSISRRPFGAKAVSSTILIHCVASLTFTKTFFPCPPPSVSLLSSFKVCYFPTADSAPPQPLFRPSPPRRTPLLTLYSPTCYSPTHSKRKILPADLTTPPSQFVRSSSIRSLFPLCSLYRIFATPLSQPIRQTQIRLESYPPSSFSRVSWWQPGGGGSLGVERARLWLVGIH